MKTRATQSEQLDNLSLHGDELHQALKSLAWINRFFGIQQSMIRTLFQVIKNHPEKRALKIIDLGCGGGDLLLAIAKALQKKEIGFELIGIDGNAATLDYAKKECQKFPAITFQKANILAPSFSIPACDILISSHFIYHFSATQLLTFFNKNMPHIQLAFINSGLERSHWASRLFKAAQFLLPISSMAKKDGLLAIRRAFTKKELSAIAKQTGYNFVLTREPLFRMRLIISKKRTIGQPIENA